MPNPTIVIARSADADADCRAIEDRLADVLSTDYGLDTCVVPHLYYLDPGHAAVAHLRSLRGPLVVAARLFPRVTHWLLHALGVDVDGGRVHGVDLRCYTDAETCIHEAVAPRVESNGSGRPGERIVLDDPVRERWYPVLDREACIDCKQCHDFCLFEVYELDDEDRVQAVRPDNCKPGCPACARVCPTAAIMFPHYTSDPAIAGDPDAPRQKPPGQVVCTIDPLSPDKAALGKASPKDQSIDGLIDALEELDDAL